MFALFRHPINRVVFQFYYTRKADWKPTYNPAISDMSVDDFAFTPYVDVIPHSANDNDHESGWERMSGNKFWVMYPELLS